MWPFKNARDKPAANSPDYGKMRNVNRTRADWTMANSEAIYAAVSPDQQHRRHDPHAFVQGHGDRQG